MTRPNILFIMTDQQRWDAMGCSGGWVKTPHLDRIAREGVRFTQCVTTTPECVPARLSMATGLYPHNTGVWDDMLHDMHPEQPTWMQALQGAGYRTSLFGKTHLVTQSDLIEKEPLLKSYGLDDVHEVAGPRANQHSRNVMTEEWKRKGVWQAFKDDYAERFANKAHVVRPSTLSLEDYYDCYVGSKARAYLDAYDRDQPWFCWVSFPGPDEPWDTPEPYASMYHPKNMPPPVARPLERPGRPIGTLDDLPLVNLEPGEALRLRANYAGHVSLIDDQIGKLLETIERRGELDYTIIAFSSDHGAMNGDYSLIYKGNFLDGAVRVPMLIRTPESARMATTGITSDSLVEWFDVGPTLVDLAGGKITYRQHACSLRGILADPEARVRPDALSEFRSEIMLMTERWKAALNRRGEVYLLFDRKNDPWEQNNLAGREGTRTIEMQLKLRVLERLMTSEN